MIKKGLFLIFILLFGLFSLMFTSIVKANSDIEILRPESDGTYTEYPTVYPEYPITHFDKVDEETADDGATYIATGDEGDIRIDSFNLPATDIIDEPINWVRVYNRAYCAGGMPSTSTMLRTYSTDYYGSWIQPESYTTYYTEYTNNPYTESSWTVDELNALEVGVRGVSGWWSVIEGWVATRCTQVYLSVSYKVEVEVDCNFIGVNNTVVDEVIEFSSEWTDLNDSDGLSHYLFSSNMSEVWVNGSWLDLWVGNWSVVSKTLNSTVGFVVAFKFFVNDSSGVEYVSTICFFTVSSKGFTIGFVSSSVCIGIACLIALGLVGRKRRWF